MSKTVSCPSLWSRKRRKAERPRLAVVMKTSKKAIPASSSASAERPSGQKPGSCFLSLST
jgi:hypothetical protein